MPKDKFQCSTCSYCHYVYGMGNICENENSELHGLIVSDRYKCKQASWMNIIDKKDAEVVFSGKQYNIAYM